MTTRRKADDAAAEQATQTPNEIAVRMADALDEIAHQLLVNNIMHRLSTGLSTLDVETLVRVTKAEEAARRAQRDADAAGEQEGETDEGRGGGPEE